MAAVWACLLLGLLLGAAVDAAVVDWDNSPVCRANLPACQASCVQPNDYLFVCSAGSGPNGGPSVKCNCVTPAEPSGGTQRGTLSLTAFPGAQACKQKTWINDCGTTLFGSIIGSAVNVTPSITNAFGKPCITALGIVVGPNRAAMSLPGYPLGLLTTNPDGSVNIRFAAFDDGSQDCFATYQIVDGSFMNSTTAAPGALGATLGGPAAATALGGQAAPANLAALGGLGLPPGTSAAAAKLPSVLFSLLAPALGLATLALGL